jgi:hypothetical protein
VPCRLLSPCAGYVGGNHYFGAFDNTDVRAKLIVEVSEEEQEALRRQDRRRINANNVLEGGNTEGLRRAITTFVVAACVRRWQQREAGERLKKYAIVTQNDTQRAAHSWQDQVIDRIFEAIIQAAENDPKRLKPLFNAAFDDLEASVKHDKGRMPTRDDTFGTYIDALQSDDIVVEKVNSDGDVMTLLDANAELKLRTPYNIWVGGNILDRGITTPDLISFYYGRNPATM